MDVYCQVRAQTLRKSMEGLKDHLSKKSAGSAAAGSYSPLIVSTSNNTLHPPASPYTTHPSPILTRKTLMRGIEGLKDHLHVSPSIVSMFCHFSFSCTLIFSLLFLCLTLYIPFYDFECQYLSFSF